jgi:predicted nucleotidyltransferase
MDPKRTEAMARRHGVLLLVQFGSSVTGRLHPGSDVDFGALLERVPDSFSAHADLIADLQALVPDREVDLVLLNRADPLLLKQITDHCELVFGPSSRLDELKLYAFKRYQDHRPFLEMEQAYVDRMIAAMAR